MQLLVPGGSASTKDLDVKFSVFQKLLKHAIEQKYVQKPSKEVQPGVIPMPTPPQE